MKLTKIIRSKRRLWAIPVAIIILPVFVVFIVGQFTPVLSTWIFKQAIDSYQFAQPENFATIEANLISKTNLVYDEQGTLLDLYYPKERNAPLPVIVWIHGGGFIGGSKELSRAYAMTMANQGYLVANINYDLAPGHKYPRPVVQANQALQYLREHAGEYGGDVDRLFLISNSAGTQITSQLAAITSNPEFAQEMGILPSVTSDQLRGVILYDGGYDMRTIRATHAPLIVTELWAYTGVRPFEDYARIDELSTVLHVTPDYPPVFLAVGGSDPLESQSLEFQEVLRKNQVEVEAFLYTGTGAHLGHDFMMDLDTQPAQQTLQQALDFLARHQRP